MGIIIFENWQDHRYEVIFAFICKVTQNTFIRSGFILKGMEVGRLMAQWFDGQVFDDTSQTYVLRDRDPKNKDRKKWVDFDHELAVIEKRYYQPQIQQSAALKLVQ